MTQPIRLVPTYKEMIWGGDSLRTYFGREIPSNLTGESWEVHSDNLIVGTHKRLADIAQDVGLMGEKIAKLATFPLLVKLITAQDDLSIQVHPDDVYAQRVEGKPYGKTECWYILDAPENAELIIGVKPDITHTDQLRRLLEQGDILSGLNYLPVKKGDFIYIPAGTVHAITKGITILEVQQTSDITYRLFDYNRRDTAGNLRELHVDKSMDVIVLGHTDNPLTGTAHGAETTLIANDFFTVKKYALEGVVSMNLPQDSASIMACTAGTVALTYGEYKETLAYGDTLILPVGVATCTVASAESEASALILAHL